MTRLPASLLGLLLLTLAMPGATAAFPKRVLLLHSFGHDFSPYNKIPGVFRAELAGRTPEPLDFYEVTLETARFSDPTEEGPLVDYLGALFQARRLDLLVPIGGPAAQFAQRHRQRLFPDTPMVITAADQRHLETGPWSPNDTAIASSVQPSRIIETLLHVLPQTTNIAVVIGDSPIERFWLEALRRDFQPFTNRVRFEWLNGRPFPDQLEHCAKLPAHSAIFLPLLLLDIQGVPQLEERVLPQLHAVANAPLFGIWRTQLGRGIVGGPLLDFEELSLNAARIAARILQGEAPGGLRVPPQAPGIPEFDWGELRRWGIREASLPTGSVVRFRQPTFWQLYRWPVTGIGLFCCAQAALIIVLLVNRTRRRQSEAINQATFDQAAVGIAHVGLDGRWLRVNDRMCAIVGYPREELLQLTFQDLTHPDDLEPDLHRVRQLLSGELHTYSMEKRYLRKDRSVVWGNLGARFFLRKPVDDQALLDAIRWVVEGTHPHPAAP